jgi:hypothetical protein
MTNTFASNKYRESGVEHCNYKKSACVDMKRMKIWVGRENFIQNGVQQPKG